MGVSGSPQIRNARSNSRNSRGKRAGPSSEPLDLDEKDGSSGEVEVEVAKKNMKVSSEAWKAFQVYQKYEDWASETEKTDYTYSRLSSYRHKEVIPGFPVRPNLCRSPIKPNSQYDYSSEREEYLQNISNSSRSNCRPRKLVLEDTVDTIETVEQLSLYRRLVQSLIVTWTLIKASSARNVERVGAGVQHFSALFAGVFVSIWASTAAAFSSVGASVLRRWNSLVTRESETTSQGVAEGDQHHWLTENAGIIWIRTNIHTVVTTVTTFYHEAAKSEVAGATRRKYLWLLLLPLLLLAGSGILYYYSINPATIVLSLSYKTYDVLTKSPSFVYDLVVEKIPFFVTEAIPQFFIEILPYFFMTFIPNFFTVTIPEFFTIVLPEYYWAAVGGLGSFSTIPFSYFEPYYYLEASYTYLVLFFTYATTSLYSVYAWVWHIFAVIVSSIGFASFWVTDLLFDGSAYFYETMTTAFNFSAFTDSTEIDKPNIILGSDTPMEIPPLEI